MIIPLGAGCPGSKMAKEHEGSKQNTKTGWAWHATIFLIWHRPVIAKIGGRVIKWCKNLWISANGSYYIINVWCYFITIQPWRKLHVKSVLSGNGLVCLFVQWPYVSNFRQPFSMYWKCPFVHKTNLVSWRSIWGISMWCVSQENSP